MKIARISLSIILFIYLVPTVLSLIDIYHAHEPDLSTEWAIVNIFLIMVLVFIGLNWIEAWRTKK